METTQNQPTENKSTTKSDDERLLGPEYYANTSVRLLYDDLLDEVKCLIVKDTSALRSLRDCPPVDRQGKLTRKIGRDKKQQHVARLLRMIERTLMDKHEDVQRAFKNLHLDDNCAVIAKQHKQLSAAILQAFPKMFLR